MSGKLELICSKCSKAQTVNLSKESKCKHCEEELADKKYIKKPLFNISTFKSIIIGMSIGISVSLLVYFTFKQDRYSPQEEYILITNCKNKSDNLSGRSPDDKLKICIEAYSQTLTEKQNFKNLFEKNVAIITH
ncbi:MAG: hypothetical protein AB7U44_06025 [Sulfuricurvum sp.]